MWPNRDQFITSHSTAKLCFRISFSASQANHYRFYRLFRLPFVLVLVLSIIIKWWHFMIPQLHHDSSWFVSMIIIWILLPGEMDTSFHFSSILKRILRRRWRIKRLLIIKAQIQVQHCWDALTDRVACLKFVKWKIMISFRGNGNLLWSKQQTVISYF